MTENKKNPVAAMVFILFVIVFPVVTVFFSKKGLDKFKVIRSEMQFLKDSIRINFNDLPTYWNAALDNEGIRDKLVVVGFLDRACQQDMDLFVDSLKSFRNNFEQEDRGKLLFVIHLDNFAQDSTWSLDQMVEKWDIDTTYWRFLQGIDRERYKIASDYNCSTIAILDGRVSRKDDSGNYKNGPLLCDYYNLDDPNTVEQLLRHIALIMPVKQRKKIEYKAEEKLY